MNMIDLLVGGRLPCAEYETPGVQKIYHEGYATCVEIIKLLMLHYEEEFIHFTVNYSDS